MCKVVRVPREARGGFTANELSGWAFDWMRYSPMPTVAEVARKKSRKKRSAVLSSTREAHKPADRIDVGDPITEVSL